MLSWHPMAIVLLAIIVQMAIAVILAYRARHRPERKLLARWNWLRTGLLGEFIVVLILSWQLPQTAVLGSFGRPRSRGDVEPSKLVECLQGYNDAIIQTKEVVQAFLMSMIFLVLVPLAHYIDKTGAAACKVAWQQERMREVSQQQKDHSS